MKNLFLLLFITSAALVGCSSNNSSDSSSENVDKTGPAYTSAYVCPMHCEGSGSAEAGKCPTCGMDYVMNEDASETEGHTEMNTDHDHAHDHDNMDQDHDHEHEHMNNDEMKDTSQL